MDTGTHLSKQILIASSAGRVQRCSIAAVTLAILAFLVFAPMRASAAVTISSFTAQAKAPQIQVAWKTATEVNNAGFNLLRSTSQGGTYTKIAGLIPAKNPGSILGASYSYSDGAVTPGQTYFYKLVSVESNGGTQQFGPISAAIPANASPTSPARTATLAPTPVPSATSTRVPSATSALIPSPTSKPTNPVGVASSPTRATKGSQPSATSTPNAVTAGNDPKSPTPGLTLVAIGIKQSTPEPDAASLETDISAGDTSAARSYYFDRLVISGVLLTSVLMLMGTVVLGMLALYFFMRANLR